MRTHGVSNTISWKQGNQLGFQKKSFRGHLEDFKAECARAGRMDLWHRLLAIKERRPISVRAVTAVTGILHKRGAAFAEHYMGCMETSERLSPMEVYKTRVVGKRSTGVGCSTLDRSTKRTREAHLVIPDEPWMEPVE